MAAKKSAKKKTPRKSPKRAKAANPKKSRASKGKKRGGSVVVCLNVARTAAQKRRAQLKAELRDLNRVLGPEKKTKAKKSAKKPRRR
jgi:hypothetical protein